MSAVAEHQEPRWPPLERGCAVPYALFTEQIWFEREQQRLFRGPTWSFVGLDIEVTKPGDFKTTYVGAIPVVVTRDHDGALHVLENRCAHRGALVCREPRGNQSRLSCVYHQWTYDLGGHLLGVPFRGGIRGNGGMPDNFDAVEHGLKRLRVATLHGLIFAQLQR